jgi:hypothetical protein
LAFPLIPRRQELLLMKPTIRTAPHCGVFSEICQTERRIALRYPCEADGTWKLLTADDGQPGCVRVRNISTDGLSLRVNRHFAPGILLAITLYDKDRGRVSLAARVVHVRRDDNGDWILGCAFIEKLSHQELQKLL